MDAANPWPATRTRSETSATTPTVPYELPCRGTSSTLSSWPTSTGNVMGMPGNTTVSSKATIRSLVMVTVYDARTDSGDSFILENRDDTESIRPRLGSKRRSGGRRVHLHRLALRGHRRLHACARHLSPVWPGNVGRTLRSGCRV